MKKRSIFYVVIMAIMGVLSYILIYNGLFLKNKIYINYEVDNSVKYKVNLLEDSMYNQESLKESNMFIASKVKDIDFDIEYNILYDKDITGYYTYTGNTKIMVYDENSNEKLFERDYQLDKNTVVLNENNDRDINIVTSTNVPYNKYREEILVFANENNINISSYILLNYDIDLVLNLDNVIEDTKKLEIMIPLTLDTFKIKTISNEDGINSYYDYSNSENVNYMFLILGLLCLSIFISLLVLIIKNIIDMYKEENKYKRELKSILNKYNSVIINVKKIVNYKSYNLIYVDSFKELTQVYDKCNNPISYKEIRRNKEALFVLIENDNAWIYRLNS